MYAEKLKELGVTLPAAPGKGGLYAPTKTFATDPQLDQPPYFFEGYAWFPQYPELRIRRLTEEHGMVTAEGPMPELKVGDMLEAIPVHICPTVNLQNQIYVADGGVLRTEIVAGRGKLQ